MHAYTETPAFSHGILPSLDPSYRIYNIGIEALTRCFGTGNLFDKRLSAW